MNHVEDAWVASRPRGPAAGWLVALVCLALAGSSCSRPSDPPAEIRIGLLADHPSGVADITLEAAELAVAKANAGGGIEIDGRKHPVKLFVEDTGDTPEGATQATLQLINRERVAAIVGSSFSRNAIPSGEIAERAGIPMICPGSTHPRTTAGRRYVFRVSFIDPFQGRVMASFARRDLGLGTAAVLYDVAEAYSRDIAAEFREVFEADGGRVVAFEPFTTGDLDFTRQLERIADLDPEAVLLPNYPDQIVVQGRELRRLGSDAVLLGCDAWLASGLETSEGLDGSFFSVSWHRDLARSNAAAQAFITEYREARGDEPGAIAALSYDAFGLLFEAIARARAVDPEAIRDALADLEEYPGVTGPITFRDRGGDPLRTSAILRIADGEVRLYRLVGAATGS